MAHPFDLSGRKALVTGGATGIGKGIALGLAGVGADDRRDGSAIGGLGVGAGGDLRGIGVGGGGGSLETPGPYRPCFQNQVRRCHHYVMAHVNAGTLELRSYDLDDRLFDTVTLRKK